MTEKNKEKETKKVVEQSESAVKVYTKAEIEAFVADISKRVVGTKPLYMHAMLAVNQILRQPNLPDLLDKDLKEQLKDIWLKLIKSTDIQVANPPLLFGYPEIVIAPTETESEEVTTSVVAKDVAQQIQ
ncbi:MAG: hypothetical protein KBC84_02690 [Proteobacteria bacterium]|nr:hypothetical protein [Pseudomonadota bacterium]